MTNGFKLINTFAKMYIFLTHSSSGNFAETRDGLDSRGADRHRVSPNHPKFHQNSPRAVDEWGNELFLMFEKLGVKKINIIM